MKEKFDSKLFVADHLNRLSFLFAGASKMVDLIITYRPAYFSVFFVLF